MSIHRWMDKEAVVHIYNGTLLSHKKECIWVSSNKVHKRRAYYIEWSKSERGKEMFYINAYMWNLAGWYWWTYLQSSSGDADMENRLWTQWGKEKGDEWGEQHRNIHTTICKTESQWEFAVWHRELRPGALWQPRGLGWGGKREEAQGGGDICVPITDSCTCKAETNTTL